MKSLVPILLVAMSVSALGQTMKPKKAMPARRAITESQQQFLVPPEDHHRYVVTGVIATTTLVESTTPPPALKMEARTGAFACARLWKITLEVGSTSVNVVPPLLEVEAGDCVLWTAVATDKKSVGIRQLKFFDAATDIPAGKDRKPNPIKVGRTFCETPEEPECAMLVALPPGRYGYKVVVRHGTTDKITDPDLDVSCTGCIAP